MAFTILATLALSTPASARHLNYYQAVSAAEFAAYEYANTPPVGDQYEVGTCTRVAPRKQRCGIASYKLPTPGYYGQVCAAWADVWLARWSSQLRYRIDLTTDVCWYYNPQVQSAPAYQWNWVYSDPLSAWPTADIHP